MLIFFSTRKKIGINVKFEIRLVFGFHFVTLRFLLTISMKQRERELLIVNKASIIDQQPAGGCCRLLAERIAFFIYNPWYIIYSIQAPTFCRSTCSGNNKKRKVTCGKIFILNSIALINSTSDGQLLMSRRVLIIYDIFLLF